MSKATQQALYKDEVIQYTKKDAVHALLFAIYIYLLNLAYWVLINVFNLDGTLKQLFGVVLVLIALLPLFFIIKAKKQGLRSIGLHLCDWKKMLGVGLFFVAVLMMLFNGLLPGLLAGWQFRPAHIILWLIIFQMIMAFWEDVIFVGYIQTRIYGLIKKDFLAVLVVGLIFAAFHYPLFIVVNVVGGGGSFGFDFWIRLFGQTLVWIIGYIILNAVYRRFSSIIPVTLLHFSMNFSGIGHLWESGGGDGLNGLIPFGVVIFSVLLVTVLLPRFKKRKSL